MRANPSHRTINISQEEIIYRQFARVYPHESFDNDPERFWKFFSQVYPDVSREDMERALEATRK